jgi:CRP-like cAMP-binding protein
MADVVEFLAGTVLFQGLGSAELTQIAGLATRFQVGAGQSLFRHGDPSDGMYLVERGTVAISARLPGDLRVSLNLMGPGSHIGDVALLDDGPRTATANALEDVEGFFFAKRNFDAIFGSRVEFAKVVHQRLILDMCARVRGLVAALQEEVRPEDLPQRTVSWWVRHGAVDRLGSRADTPFADLPFFSGLTSVELDVFLRCVRVREVPRGEMLQTAGASTGDHHWVLRGALRSSIPMAERALQVAVHGPGQVAGAISALDSRPPPFDLVATERSTIARMSQATLQELRARGDSLGWKIDDCLNRHVVRLLRMITEVQRRVEVESVMRSREE